jgi:hypothetical protein
MALESLSWAQQTQVNALLEQVKRRFHRFTTQEREVFTTLWMSIARVGMPVPIHPAPIHNITNMMAVVAQLEQRGLLWLDVDMQAVLQCPPFSAIRTNHLVKAFGWNAAYACTLADVPLTLLLYGPNAWLEIKTICHETGSPLTFSVLLDEHRHLHLETPDEAADWRVWIPHSIIDQPPSIERDVGLFATCDALDAYCAKHPEQEGVSYSINEAILLSEALILAYKQALSNS